MGILDRFSLKNRIALVSGGAGPMFGSSISEALAEAGATVITASRSLERNEAFADTAGRRAGQDRIDAALAAHFAEHDLEATVEGLVSAGVPAAPVVPSPLVMRNPQHLARGFYETVEHPVAGAQPYPRLPMRFAAGPERHIAKPAPLLGQDNDAVLGERLGLDADARSALREAGVVGERPHGY